MNNENNSTLYMNKNQYEIETKLEELSVLDLIKKISKNRLEFNIKQNKNNEIEKKAVIRKIIQEEYIDLFDLMVNSDYLLQDNMEEEVIKIISDKTKHSSATSWATNLLRTQSKTTNYNLVLEAFNKKMQNSNTIKSIEDCLYMINHFSKFINKHISIEQEKALSIQTIKSFFENKKMQNKTSITKKNSNSKIL